MTTQEIIEAITKGSFKTSISEKQRSWLLSVAKKEGYAVEFTGHYHILLLTDRYYTIHSCSRFTSGGSYVGKKTVNGRYNIHEKFCVKFNDTGIVQVYDKSEFHTLEKHTYTIINPREANII